MAWRVRPDQRWDAGVGAGGGQPGSNTMKGRSLAVDQPYAVQTFPGVRHDMAHAGGRSHAVERLGEAAAILRINRRRKALYGGLFPDSELMSVPGVELVGKQHQGKALTRRLLRRQAASPGGRRTIGRQGGWSRRGKRHDLATTTLGVGAAGKPRTEGFV
jgi:hypothetical protein